LTHRSVLHDWLLLNQDVDAILQSNERLEFLGDALLGAIVAEHLYAVDPVADEGALTRHRVALVRAETLVRWAREMHLDEALYLGTGESVTHSARDRMLAGAFEALIAAIALDGGMRKARRFLRRFLDRDIGALIEEEQLANPKGRLQETLQERYRVGPVYRTIRAEGPSHARIFTAEVSLAGRPLGRGVGGSKRDAEQAAAKAALEHLDILPAELEDGGHAGDQRRETKGV
ncbi:MAG TPA: ribonuclease III, partial [Thermomicrobiales bacterium]|nr:ribonuclease III [Thermomicrobiales bacterium]